MRIKPEQAGAHARRLYSPPSQIVDSDWRWCQHRSGIPDYRDGDGAWKRKQPVQHQAFMGSVQTRQRYWAAA